jgi:DNA-binding MarR family transcriptional regulator
MAVMDTTPDAPSPLTPRDPRLAPWRAFVRAHAHVSRRLDEDLRAEHAMSLQEYASLLILAEAPGRRLRMGRLAEALTISRSGATRLIDRLVEGGLVERLSCPSDLRGAEARLTEAGLSRLRTAAPTHLRGIAEYFLATIAPEDLPDIERVMTDVARCASEAPGGRCAPTAPRELAKRGPAPSGERAVSSRPRTAS